MDYLNELIQAPLKTILEPLKRLNHHLADHLSPKPVSVQPTPVAPHCAFATIDSMGTIVRLAGLSGATAVVLGAYGSHSLKDSVDDRRKKAFDTGSRYHLLHSVVLLGSRQARFPLLTAALFSAGIVFFCGPCYHYSITGDEKLRKFTPGGGILLILGWLSFIL